MSTTVEAGAAPRPSRVLAPPPGPQTVLPPLHKRRWPKLLGNLFFLWALAATAVLSVAGSMAAFVALTLFRARRVTWQMTILWARYCMRLAGIRHELVLEHPLPPGPVVFAANHNGTYDILATFDALGPLKEFVFVAKHTVFMYPFIGWHIKLAGYISVNRRNREEAIKSLKAGAKRIREGVSVCIYPEGTRSRDGSILPFKKGPFMLALEAGVPIIPVAIEGALDIQPRRQLYVCPGTVRIICGPPIPTEGLTEADRDDLMRVVRTEVIRMHKRIGGLGGDVDNAIAASGSEGVGKGRDEAMP